MKIFKYLPIAIMMLFCLCICGVGVYAFSLKSIQISGSLSILPANSNCKIDYGITITNAREDNTYSLNVPPVRYINSTNSVLGELISIENENKNIGFGNLYFSSHGEEIEDICISITLKNNSIYPVLINFSLGDKNTVGVYTDTLIKDVYISNNSQELGYSATLNQNAINTFDFYLKLNDPTSDLSSSYVIDLNVGFTKITNSNDFSNEITTNVPSSAIAMVNDTVVEYVETAETTAINEFVASYNTRLDQCKDFTFEYTCLNSVAVAIFELDTSQSFETAKIYTLLSNTLTLQNLLINTKYYYRLTLITENGESICKTGVLQTAKTPRILTIDGAYNVRDIGGWQESANIKQGLFFRGTELDGLVYADYTATAEGLKALSELGIVTDFDIRGSTTKSPIEGVNKINYSALAYSAVFKTSANTVTKNIFSALAEPSNYPMYLHCTYGCDRTGTICYLLEALLGVSDVELIIDYELSALTKFGGNRTSDAFVEFLDALAQFDGSTTEEKVTTYLLSIGITETQIQSIKNIFLG